MANDFQKAFRYGIDQPTENVATTLEALGFDTQAKELRDLIEAPEDWSWYRSWCRLTRWTGGYCNWWDNRRISWANII
jgi:alpha-ketoglutarate-dependent taurine dioxygenase